MNLFEQHRQQVAELNPLAARMPRSLEEFIGQDHMIGPVVCYVVPFKLTNFPQ